MAHRLVDFVLLAEFDIDAGSTIRHVYPNRLAVPEGYSDDSFAEMMLPEGIHHRESDSTFIFLNRGCTQWGSQAHQSLSEEACDKWLCYGFNVVRRQRDDNARRGAVIKAMAIFSRHHFVESLRRPLEMALDAYFARPDISILASLFNSLNKIDMTGLQMPSPLQQCLARRSLGEIPEQLLGKRPKYNILQEHKVEVRLDFNGSGASEPSSPLSSSVLEVALPLHRTPDEVCGDVSVCKLISNFGGEGTMRIYNAILGQKRIIFVGHGHSAEDVAGVVLSAVALVYPAISNTLRRVFPYANLTDLSFLEVSGLIAGVTNPMFVQKESWWDLLCVLDSTQGRGTVVPSGQDGVNSSSNNVSESGLATTSSADGSQQQSNRSNFMHDSADKAFISAVSSGIAANCGEEWVRQKFLNLTSSIVDQVHNQPSLLLSPRLSTSALKSLEANSRRAELLKKDDSASLSTNPQSSTGASELRKHVRRLQHESSFASSNEAETIFSAILQALESEADVQSLLALLPESVGGLHAIAIGMFCPSPTVRRAAVQILERVRQYESTRPAFEAMNSSLARSFQTNFAKLQR